MVDFADVRFISVEFLVVVDKIGLKYLGIFLASF
jgi:hypothetical protein